MGCNRDGALKGVKSRMQWRWDREGLMLEYSRRGAVKGLTEEWSRGGALKGLMLKWGTEGVDGEMGH